MAARGEGVAPTARDPVVADILYWGYTIAYWIFWPIGIALYYVAYYASFALLFVIKLIWRPLEFVLLPLYYLGKFVLACFAAPFKFLAKFETLYIYLGIAALVGITLGLFISLIAGSLNKILGLEPESTPPGRTAKQYREARRKQRVKAEAPLMSPGYISPGYLSLSDGMRKGNRGKGLISQTIMEEVDSDY